MHACRHLPTHYHHRGGEARSPRQAVGEEGSKAWEPPGGWPHKRVSANGTPHVPAATDGVEMGNITFGELDDRPAHWASSPNSKQHLVSSALLSLCWPVSPREGASSCNVLWHLHAFGTNINGANGTTERAHRELAMQPGLAAGSQHMQPFILVTLPVVSRKGISVQSLTKGCHIQMSGEVAFAHAAKKLRPKKMDAAALEIWHERPLSTLTACASQTRCSNESQASAGQIWLVYQFHFRGFAFDLTDRFTYIPLPPDRVCTMTDICARGGNPIRTGVLVMECTLALGYRAYLCEQGTSSSIQRQRAQGAAGPNWRR